MARYVTSMEITLVCPTFWYSFMAYGLSSTLIADVTFQKTLKKKMKVYLVRVYYITLSVLPPPSVLSHQNFIWCSSLKMCIKSCSSCRSSTLSHKASSPRQGRCRQLLQHIEPSVWRFCGEQAVVAPTLFGVYALTWQNNLEAFIMNLFASNWGPSLCLTQPRPGRKDTHTAFLSLNLFAGKLKIWNIHWDYGTVRVVLCCMLVNPL